MRRFILRNCAIRETLSWHFRQQLRKSSRPQTYYHSRMIPNQMCLSCLVSQNSVELRKATENFKIKQVERMTTYGTNKTSRNRTTSSLWILQKLHWICTEGTVGSSPATSFVNHVIVPDPKWYNSPQEKVGSFKYTSLNEVESNLQTWNMKYAVRMI